MAMLRNENTLERDEIIEFDFFGSRFIYSSESKLIEVTEFNLY